MFKEGELHMQQYPVRTIDLEALRENVRLLRSTLPEKTKLMAVVKADAYGHGIAKVARAALEAGASALAVARTDEGAALRQAGVTAPVLVLGASSDEEIAEGVRNELTLTVCTPEMVDTLESCAKDSGLMGLMHLKIDTGMGRIGVRTEEEIRAILARLQVSPHVRLTGAFTHFADADGSDMAYTRMQFERFQQLLTLLPDGIVRHCANSAAIHRCPEAALDMVRAGISMYAGDVRQDRSAGRQNQLRLHIHGGKADAHCDGSLRLRRRLSPQRLQPRAGDSARAARAGRRAYLHGSNDGGCDRHSERQGGRRSDLDGLGRRGDHHA